MLFLKLPIVISTALSPSPVCIRMWSALRGLAMKPKMCAIDVQNVSLQLLHHSNPKCTQHDNQVQTEVAKQTKTILI